MFLFRVVFTNSTGVPSAVHVIAYNAAEAIAVAVQHRKSKHTDVIQCERCVTCDAVSAPVRADLRRDHLELSIAS